MSVKGEKVNGVAGMLRTTVSVGGEFLTWWYKEKGVTLTISQPRIDVIIVTKS